MIATPRAPWHSLRESVACHFGSRLATKCGELLTLNHNTNLQAKPSAGDSLAVQRCGEWFRERRHFLLEQMGLRREVIDLGADAPLATVVVLNYNGEHVLRRCLDSLLALTYPNFEVLIVDNCSSDVSKDIIAEYEAAKPAVIRSLMLTQNEGVAGGRNAALPMCRGELIAFMDNDGYPDPTWLSASIAELKEDSGLGAVAPLVFFSSRETLLNGAGGFRDQRGHARDICFSEPLEFAHLPSEVLYPMGCGMVLTRDACERVFPLDSALPKWFDDVELGEKVWRAGYSVKLCPFAHVVHGFHGTERQEKRSLWRQALLFEKARIRHALKYPARNSVFYFAVVEASSWLRRIGKPRQLLVELLAWCWNLLNIRSAMVLRRKYAERGESVSDLYTKEMGPAYPDNHLLRANTVAWGPVLDFEGGIEEAMLHYGWFPVECAEATTFRRAAEHAACFFRIPSGGSKGLAIKARGSERAVKVKFRVRSLGHQTSEESFLAEFGTGAWQTLIIPLKVEGGDIELQIHCFEPHSLEVAAISFELADTDG